MGGGASTSGSPRRGAKDKQLEAFPAALLEEFEVDLGDHWAPLDKSIVQAIASQEAKGGKVLDFHRKGNHYRVDLKEMVQVNCQTGTRRALRRCSERDPFVPAPVAASRPGAGEPAPTRPGTGQQAVELLQHLRKLPLHNLIVLVQQASPVAASTCTERHELEALFIGQQGAEGANRQAFEQRGDVFETKNVLHLLSRISFEAHSLATIVSENSQYLQIRLRSEVENAHPNGRSAEELTVRVQEAQDRVVAVDSVIKDADAVSQKIGAQLEAGYQDPHCNSLPPVYSLAVRVAQLLETLVTAVLALQDAEEIPSEEQERSEESAGRVAALREEIAVLQVPVGHTLHEESSRPGEASIGVGCGTGAWPSTQDVGVGMGSLSATRRSMAGTCSDEERRRVLEQHMGRMGHVIDLVAEEREAQQIRIRKRRKERMG